MSQMVIMLVGMGLVLLMMLQSEHVGVPPVPSGPRSRKAALELLAGMNPHKIVELGAGWGGMTRKLARTFPQADVTGYEKSWMPLLVGKLATLANRRIKFIGADMFTADLRDVDIVYCYLLPVHLDRLQGIFDAQLKAGAVVVSVSFPLPRKQAADTRTVRGVVDIPVYLYRW